MSPAGKAEQGNRVYRRFIGGRLLPDKRKETILVLETYEAGELLERLEERSLVGIVDREEVCCLLREACFEVNRELS